MNNGGIRTGTDNLAIDEYGLESPDSHRALARGSVTFMVKYFACGTAPKSPA